MDMGKGPAGCLGVHIGDPCVDAVVGAHTGHADLADAASVVVRGFDIKRDKAEGAIGEGEHRVCLSLVRAVGQAKGLPCG